MAEQRVHIPWVGGSNPLSATKHTTFVWVDQQLESGSGVLKITALASPSVFVLVLLCVCFLKLSQSRYFIFGVLDEEVCKMLCV